MGLGSDNTCWWPGGRLHPLYTPLYTFIRGTPPSPRQPVQQGVAQGVAWGQADNSGTETCRCLCRRSECAYRGGHADAGGSAALNLPVLIPWDCGSEGGRGGCRQVGWAGKGEAGPKWGLSPKSRHRERERAGMGLFLVITETIAYMCVHTDTYIHTYSTSLLPRMGVWMGRGGSGGSSCAAPCSCRGGRGGCWLRGAGDPSGMDPAPQSSTGGIQGNGGVEAAEPAPRAMRTRTHPLRLAGVRGTGRARRGGCSPTPSLLREGTEKKELNEWKLEETWGTSPLPANPRGVAQHVESSR